MKKSCFKGCFCPKEGFTLIELLVVVLIVGILAAGAVPQYQVAVLKSRYTQLQSMVRSLKEAETVYFLTHGEHSLDLEKLDVEMPVIPGYSFEIWLADDKKSGVIAGFYKSLYYHESLFSSSRQCRANKNDKLANAVCINLGGTYVDTYESQKAYRLP